jgi:hypothetical protein
MIFLINKRMMIFDIEVYNLPDLAHQKKYLKFEQSRLSTPKKIFKV